MSRNSARLRTLEERVKIKTAELCEEIAARKKGEAELRQSEEMYRVLCARKRVEEELRKRKMKQGS